jgi:predicted NBD/HSP70 family sugar kinase
MYLGVDIGGTKTLVASLDDNGVIKEKLRFLTPKDYVEFLSSIRQALEGFETHEYIAGSVAVPAIKIDRTHGEALGFGNLPWGDVNIEKDIEQIVNCPILIENDAKLGGLSEAMLVKDQYSKVLYVTVSTGIGYAIINDCVIDTNAGDAGGKIIMLNRNGGSVSWESIASGKAIVEKYGKMAKDINDNDTWQEISKEISAGLIELIEVFQPDIIVIGGSVGNYFSKYGELLNKELEKYELPLINLPVLKGAERADDAVIYGCYDLAHKTYGNG